MTPVPARAADYRDAPMRTIVLFVLCFVFFALGLYAGGFATLIAWAVAASAFLMALD